MDLSEAISKNTGSATEAILYAFKKICPKPVGVLLSLILKE
jgi:hypothetical protein